MKKNKIIGIIVASLGVIVSMAGAAALYIKGANNTQFAITPGAYQGSTGQVTYTVEGNVSGSVAPQYWKANAEAEGGKTGTGLGGDYTQVVYEMSLGAQFAEGLNAQDFVLGNLSISVTNIPSSWQGKMSIWVDIDGYIANSIGAVSYGHVFMTEDYGITSEHTSYSDSKDVTVAAAGTQKVRIMLKYNLEGIDLLEQNEASLGYSLNVTWGAASQAYERAYVMCLGNQWTQDDEYAMVPNINKANAEGWEWVYNNLPGSVGPAKCNITKSGNTTWSSGDDAVLDSAKSYDVYWNESGSSAASFDEVH